MNSKDLDQESVKTYGELVRGMNRIPDRTDTPPEQARFIEGVKPAFAPAEVLENFEGYAKQFHEVFGGK